MPASRLVRCHLFLRCCLLLLVCALPTTLPAQTNTPNMSDQVVRFKLQDGYLMIVPTTVDGVGPFNFLLDTGTTRTVIDPALAQQLNAPVRGEVAVTGALHQRQDKLVMLKQLQLGEASVAGLGAVVDKIARRELLAPGIRGVLGEDFLSRFDILIDFRQHWLRFGDAPPEGERCRFETTTAQDRPRSVFAAASSYCCW